MNWSHVAPIGVLMNIYKASFITGYDGSGYDMYVSGPLDDDCRLKIIEYFKNTIKAGIYSDSLLALEYSKDDMRETIAYNMQQDLDEIEILDGFVDSFCKGMNCRKDQYFLQLHEINIKTFVK